MKTSPLLPSWPRWLERVTRRWAFGPLPPDADGWYVWRNSPTWPKHAYKCIEIANGVMVDTEPMDSYGFEWHVVECQALRSVSRPATSALATQTCAHLVAKGS